ncbi:hypothetical protein [Polynucleobacter necessarius]|uniref:hypothetical protein n=1 Tax=Polynucleobacter necessarius TaxID=576610 RepID=UPI000E08EAE0|nr:hypothetical protein [Polynucleobacter necessarius]
MKHLFAILVRLLLVASLGCAFSQAWSSPVSTRLNKVYKELIIQGERPEVSSCMALAFKATRENAPYEQITYPADMQAAALVQERVEGDHLIKLVSMQAMGAPRKSGFYIVNPPQKIEIYCTQMDEGIPVVSFKASEVQ